MRSKCAEATWTSRIAAAALAALLCFPLLSIQEPHSVFAQSVRDKSDSKVRIGVLGLFRPQEFTVTAGRQALVIHAMDNDVTLEQSSGHGSASIQISGENLMLVADGQNFRTSHVFVTGRNSQAADFTLAIPGKMTRHYRGTLEIKSSNRKLLAIVTMDLEIAVASVVAAESLPGTPPEALKAQAVAARSYLLAGRGRHREFDFCDTTHCQFLREPPSAYSEARRAVASTRGLVLHYESHTVPAMYTKSCSGQTRTPAQLGLPGAAYPYYSVECAYCRSHPSHWTTQLNSRDAASLRSSDESSRLKIARRAGWSAVPSNDFVATRHGDQVLLEGTGQGHGIGLCEAGATAMAKEGVTFRGILNHYYPNTTVLSQPAASTVRYEHAESSAAGTN